VPLIPLPGRPILWGPPPPIFAPPKEKNSSNGWKNLRKRLLRRLTTCGSSRESGDSTRASRTTRKTMVTIDSIGTSRDVLDDSYQLNLHFHDFNKG